MHNDRSFEVDDSIFKEEIRDETYYEDDLKDLICNQFRLGEDVYELLKEYGMDVESVSLMREDDINQLFPLSMMGTRIKFRSRVEHLKKFGIMKTTPKTVSIGIQVSPPTDICDIEQFSLFMLLMSSSKGKAVLKFFEENSILFEEHRVALVSIIVDHYKDRSIPMPMCDIVRFTDEIGILFPTEEKKYYYSPRGKGLNPKGKLHDKALNARSKLRKPDSKTDRIGSNDAVLVPTKEELEDKLWLTKNIEPCEEILQKWKSTFRIRRDEILKSENIIQNWPQLFQYSEIFSSLVESDFADLYPNKTNLLFTEWEHFKNIIITYFKEKIKDHVSKELMEKLNGDITTDSTDCLIIILLHAVIKPPLLSTKLDDSNKRRKWKPSISDAQNATIIHCRTIKDYQEKYDQLCLKESQRNKIMQPLILVIGEDITKLEEFYVLHYKILYKMPSFLKALDILFKIYHVINIGYRLEAKYLYELIESYFFQIKISSNPNIISLTNYLNHNK